MQLGQVVVAVVVIVGKGMRSEQFGLTATVARAWLFSCASAGKQEDLNARSADQRLKLLDGTAAFANAIGRLACGDDFDAVDADVWRDEHETEASRLEVRYHFGV